MRVCEHNCRYAGIRLRYLHATHEVFIGVAPAMSRVHVAAEGNDVLEKVELGHFVPPLDAIVAGLRVERSVELDRHRGYVMKPTANLNPGSRIFVTPISYHWGTFFGSKWIFLS